MPFSTRAFVTHKASLDPNECEDAVAVPDPTISGGVYRFAASDGATESAFARKWAKMLADEFVSGTVEWDDLLASIRPLQKKWSDELSREPMPWYIEEKVRQGTFAALVGLELDESDEPGGKWRAVAVGDRLCLPN